MYNILIIDDDPDILDVISTMLEERYDCNCELAQNGDEALERTSEKKYDLICTDYRMPIINGGKFIVFLRGREGPNENTPIIIITGFAEEVEHYPEGIRNVFAISKPILPNSLYSIVDEALAKRPLD